MVKIFIDPGHGGTDSGAAANGLIEKSLTLQVGLNMRTILMNEYEDVQVQMSRTTDTFIPLDTRAQMARNWGADGFVAVHFNKFNGAANGIETFRHTNSSASVPFQRALHTAVKSQMERFRPITDRGLKSANFAVLRGTYQSMVSVLTESLFLDNSRDAALLKTPGVIQAIARGHAEGVASYFHLRKKTDDPEEGEIMYPNSPTLRNAFENYLSDAVNRGIVDKKWLDEYRNRRLSLSDALALKVLIDAAPPSENVPATHAEAWRKAEEAGVLNGERPNGPLTRAQFATAANRMGLLDKTQ
ncbi:N-acetylmuramoyl-L-alanine amidase [Alteribacillus persepolensis]|uniref:N-acetylmuramoyl-L-alanine amidase n=1 Tax=Alteribacillus persepolensis TaxID=568899 RepID=A0A1G8ECH7_9BACI|nr:N-acetylmuramoyl-L-alanine amidase [Alteribacillus persepolensis]SDH67645.1 N-acetylmuramoyl-L-alanine amidase [Alteribacillus persepolensis]